MEPMGAVSHGVPATIGNSSEPEDSETTSEWTLSEPYKDERVSSFVTYRTRSYESEPGATDPSIGNTPNNPGGGGEELAEFAELAVARIVADQRSKIAKEKKPKGKRGKGSRDVDFPMDEPSSAASEDFPIEEPPRISPVPIRSKKSFGESSTNAVYYSDPPATLIIESFKSRTAPFVASDDLSDISPVLQSKYEEIKSIAPVPQKPKKKKKKKRQGKGGEEEDLGDTIALVQGTARSEDPEKGHTEVLVVDESAAGKCKAGEKNGKYSILIALLGLFVLSAVGYLVAYVLHVVRSKTKHGDSHVTFIDMTNKTIDPTATAGTGSTGTTTTSVANFVGLRPTTTMDAYQSGCGFKNSTLPHVMSQCACLGEVTILTNEVREKYYSINMLFISLNISDAWELPEESCDPRNQAILWLSTTYTQNRHDLIQKYTLASFFIQMSGQEWVDNDGWLVDEDTCGWTGVACNEMASVKNLILDGSGLKGSIPNELRLLESLESLSLRGNSITGEIPPELFLMPNIRELRLAFNSIAGSIPPDVAKASNLEVLLVDMNQLKQELPTELGAASALKELNLGFNQFEGTLPSELFQLSKMEQLSIEGNMGVTGRIPSLIGQLQNLQLFSISNTNMLSRIPSRIGRLTNLKTLKMANTQLSGELPSEMRTLTNLNHIDLSSNKFRRRLPSFFGQFPSLTYLSLNDCRFSGTIPPQLGNIGTLFHLSLHGNRLHGTLPKELGRLSSLDTLTLQDNLLTGRAPRELCNLRREELIVFTTDCSDGARGVLCPVPNCCTECVRRPA